MAYFKDLYEAGHTRIKLPQWGDTSFIEIVEFPYHPLVLFHHRGAVMTLPEFRVSGSSWQVHRIPGEEWEAGTDESNRSEGNRSESKGEKDAELGTGTGEDNTAS